MKFLVGYNSWAEGVDSYYEDVWKLLRKEGYNVHGCCLTINPPAPHMPNNSLIDAWESCDSTLIKHLNKLAKVIEQFDVFINWHGYNLPPQFIKKLSVHTVFVCNDDPESSYAVSRPAAWAYDQACVGNVAEVITYKDWGCSKVDFQPLGFAPWDVHSGLREENLNLDNRNIDVIFFGERVSKWRKHRLDRLSRAFPNALFYGKGWDTGYVPKQKMLAIYSQSKIGINIHDSTGPINQRLYQLPAHGVMQICDNKDQLNTVFKLDKEIVGFDTIGECIDLVHYYLNNKKERTEIALAGFRRVHKEYNILEIWKNLEENIANHMGKIPQIKKPVLKIKKNNLITNYIKTPLRKFLKPNFSLKSKSVSNSNTLVISSKHTNSDLDPWQWSKDIGLSANENYKPSINRVMKCDIKLGILKDFQGEYEKYIRACEELDVPFKIIDFTSERWINHIKHNLCDIYITHPNHWTSVWKELFDERLRIISKDLALRIWPNLDEVWLYECKRRQAYWMEANLIPHPKTYIFYNFDEARDFLIRTSFPIVYKTNTGAEVSGVVILEDYKEAFKFLEYAFRGGIIRNPGDSRDRSWDYVMFQEFLPDVREMRIIKIGNSWFGHEKLKNDKSKFHSGSGKVGWGLMPQASFDFCRLIAENASFTSMGFDLFLTKDGEWLINELQTVVGIYDPAQMYVDGKPGRYLYNNNKWNFEEGLFNRNGGANQRIISILESMEPTKTK